MALKPKVKAIRNAEEFKNNIRESQEYLRAIIQEMEHEFFDRIKNWKTRNVKKLYNDYSLYIIIEDLLQVIEKASQRM